MEVWRSYIILLLIILSILQSCTDEPKPKPKNNTYDKHFPIAHNRNPVIYDVINSTFKKLAPSPSENHSTIFLNERLLVADKNLIDDFVAAGASVLIYKINRKLTIAKPIGLNKIDDFGQLKILKSYPITNKEFEKNAGGAIYSRIAFNEDSTQAVFIFQFERFHQRDSKIFCAVEVKKTNKSWTILKKTCLNKHPGMLFEN